MLRAASLGLAVAFLFAAAVEAQDKKEKAAKKPTGTWVREVNGFTLKFTFRANDLTIDVKDNDGNTISIEADYGVTKDGTAYGIMTKVTNKGIEKGPEKGDLFSMKFSVTDKEMTFSDFKGTHANEESRKLVEGVYTKK